MIPAQQRGLRPDWTRRAQTGPQEGAGARVRYAPLLALLAPVMGEGSLP